MLCALEKQSINVAKLKYYHYFCKTELLTSCKLNTTQQALRHKLTTVCKRQQNT